MPVLKVQAVLLVLRVLQVLKVLLVLKVQRVSLVPKGLQALKETKVLLDQLLVRTDRLFTTVVVLLLVLLTLPLMVTT